MILCPSIHTNTHSHKDQQNAHVNGKSPIWSSSNSLNCRANAQVQCRTADDSSFCSAGPFIFGAGTDSRSHRVPHQINNRKISMSKKTAVYILCSILSLAEFGIQSC